jgi:Arc/MetJ family transcription regulator
MKTTIEIADDLLARARRVAARERKTLRQLVEEALRQRLARPNALEPFRLRKHAFAGDGRGAAVAEGHWETVRDLVYRLG